MGKGKQPSTRTRTGQLILVFLLAKAASLAAAFYLIGLDGAPQLLSLVAHGASLVFFFALMMVATKQGPGRLLEESRPDSPPLGSALLWVVLVFPLGLLIRFGSEGLLLALMHVYDPGIALEQFLDARLQHARPIQVAAAIFALATIVGAMDEEFIYRRIFQWHFCTQFGPLIGIFVVAIIFGLVHLNPVAFIASISFSCLYLLSGRLWVPVMAHVGGNLFHPMLGASSVAIEWTPYLMASTLAAAVLGAGLVLSLRAIASGPFSYAVRRPGIPTT